MTCREFVEFLDEYRTASLPHEQRAEFDRHIADCPCCHRYLESYEQTIRLGKMACCDPEGPAPSDAPDELIEAILAARKR